MHDNNDAYNRLATSQTAAETTTYTYNALGERMKKINQNGLSTVFHYGPSGELLYERDQAGNAKEYVWLDGRPLARIDNQTSLYYYHVDHLGTPQVMTNSAGATVWKADYEPFGKATVKVSTIENNLRFPGQYYDRETGLHYNYFRDYDPTTGRYVEADPIGLEGGMNLYGYVGGNPISYVDSYGLDRNVTFLDGKGSGTYSADVYVFDDQTGELFGPYQGSTSPDQARNTCSKTCPQAAEGRYVYKPALFPSNPRPNQSRYPALRLGTIPSLAPNPNNGGKMAITGTWVHRGGRKRTGSEGCLTIDPADWAEFISKFPKGMSGYVEIVR